jgi:hypothetical protein
MPPAEDGKAGQLTTRTAKLHMAEGFYLAGVVAMMEQGRINTLQITTPEEVLR